MARPGSRRILWVDDHRPFRLATDELLVLLGYRVVTSASAAEALNRMDHGLRVDLLMTDIRMPLISGIALARRLRLRQPTLPVLLVSSHRPPRYDDLGAPIAFLTKPFPAVRLGRCLDQLLAEAAS